MEFTSGLEWDKLELIPLVAQWLDLDDLCAFNWCRIFMGITMVDELFITDQEIDPQFFQQPNCNSVWQHGH